MKNDIYNPISGRSLFILFAVVGDPKDPKDMPDADDSETLKRKERQDIPNDHGRKERLDPEHPAADPYEDRTTEEEE